MGGFTVAAAGTSFPNVFSGMVVSRQGKTTMALANALGANVQNVFLALALPWLMQSCFIKGTISYALGWAFHADSYYLHYSDSSFGCIRVLRLHDAQVVWLALPCCIRSVRHIFYC